MYKLKVKLNKIKPEISRIVYVPRDIEFSDLDEILRIVFDFSYFHLSFFEFEGLNVRMWDFDKVVPDDFSAPMDVKLKDYLELFKKLTWTYDSYTFTANVRKADKKLFKKYPFVESYKSVYNPIEDRCYLDFLDMLYYAENNLEMPDYLNNFEMEYFDMDKTNLKLKDNYE